MGRGAAVVHFLHWGVVARDDGISFGAEAGHLSELVQKKHRFFVKNHRGWPRCVRRPGGSTWARSSESTSEPPTPSSRSWKATSSDGHRQRGGWAHHPLGGRLRQGRRATGRRRSPSRQAITNPDAHRSSSASSAYMGRRFDECRHRGQVGFPSYIGHPASSDGCRPRVKIDDKQYSPAGDLGDGAAEAQARSRGATWARR